MVKKEKSKLRELIDAYGIKDLNDVHEFVKALTAETIQEVLEGELENELGYSKYDYKNKQTDNARNGHSKKTVQSSQGEIELKIPRDRNAEFKPESLKSIKWTYRGLRTKSFLCIPKVLQPGILKKL